MRCPGPTPAPCIPAKSVAFGPEELVRLTSTSVRIQLEWREPAVAQIGDVSIGHA